MKRVYMLSLPFGFQMMHVKYIFHTYYPAQLLTI